MVPCIFGRGVLTLVSRQFEQVLVAFRLGWKSLEFALQVNSNAAFSPKSDVFLYKVGQVYEHFHLCGMLEIH